MIGFPGAYGAYYDLVDQHGISASKREPRSLAESGRGTIRIMPNIPAGPNGHGDHPAQHGAAPKRG